MRLYLNPRIRAKQFQTIRRSAATDRSSLPNVVIALRHASRLTDEDVAQLAESYRSGTSAKVLATQFGVHRHTVAEVVKRVGVERHSPGLTSAQVLRPAASTATDGRSPRSPMTSVSPLTPCGGTCSWPEWSCGHRTSGTAKAGRSRSESPVGSPLRPAFPGKVSPPPHRELARLVDLRGGKPSGRGSAAWHHDTYKEQLGADLVALLEEHGENR